MYLHVYDKVFHGQPHLKKKTPLLSWLTLHTDGHSWKGWDDKKSFVWMASDNPYVVELLASLDELEKKTAGYLAGLREGGNTFSFSPLLFSGMKIKPTGRQGAPVVLLYNLESPTMMSAIPLADMSSRTPQEIMDMRKTCAKVFTGADIFETHKPVNGGGKVFWPESAREIHAKMIKDIAEAKAKKKKEEEGVSDGDSEDVADEEPDESDDESDEAPKSPRTKKARVARLGGRRDDGGCRGGSQGQASSVSSAGHVQPAPPASAAASFGPLQLRRADTESICRDYLALLPEEQAAFRRKLGLTLAPKNVISRLEANSLVRRDYPKELEKRLADMKQWRADKNLNGYRFQEGVDLPDLLQKLFADHKLDKVYKDFSGEVVDTIGDGFLLYIFHMCTISVMAGRSYDRLSRRGLIGAPIIIQALDVFQPNLEFWGTYGDGYLEAGGLFLMPECKFRPFHKSRCYFLNITFPEWFKNLYSKHRTRFLAERWPESAANFFAWRELEALPVMQAIQDMAYTGTTWAWYKKWDAKTPLRPDGPNNLISRYEGQHGATYSQIHGPYWVFPRPPGLPLLQFHPS